MRHSITHRLFAQLSAVWLVLLLTEPAAIHVCAVHTGSMSHGMEASPHHSPTAQSHDRNSGHHHSAQCSCLSTSSRTTLVLLADAAEVTFDVPAILAAAPTPVEFATAAPSPPDFLLPYPNGPPAPIAA